MKPLVTAIVAACLFTASPSFATLEILYVNHATKQLAYMDEERYTGLFWHDLGGEDRHRLEAEAKYLPLGYRYTDSPVVIETTVLLAFFYIASFLVVMKISFVLWKKFIRFSGR